MKKLILIGTFVIVALAFPLTVSFFAFFDSFLHNHTTFIN